MKKALFRLLSSPLFLPFQPLVQRLFLAVRRATGRLKRHPFDRQYGVDTSGVLPATLLRVKSDEDQYVTAYVGCVPSAVRTALGSIPGLATATFIDIGCGMGRALLVARAFGFARVLGIELNPSLAARAKANAKKVMHRDPPGGVIEILTGDATTPDLPAGDCVIFLYHSFMLPMVTRLVDHITRQDRPDRRLFFVYENPVFSDVLDSNAAFSRWLTVSVPYEKEELGYGPDTVEPIAIWANAAAGKSPHDTFAQIVVARKDWRVEIVNQTHSD